jgi:glutamate-5-semialdehyde dehydrogenase
MNDLLKVIGEQAKYSEVELRNLTSEKKNQALLHAADSLVAEASFILAENAKDIEQAKENGMAPGLIDRLLLTESRIEAMAVGLRQIAGLDDPIGEVLGMKKRPNGLMIGQKRVPLGVVVGTFGEKAARPQRTDAHLNRLCAGLSLRWSPLGECHSIG